MAKRIPFDSLTTDDLLVNVEDDPYKDFPLLNLKTFDIYPRVEFVCTTNHARGTKDTGSEKREALVCSIHGGWDRTSWPIPFMLIEGRRDIFDRRHTLTAIEKLRYIKRAPGAEYTRADVPEWNGLSDRSVLEIAAILGNVTSPVPADTKDHHFVHSAIKICQLEDIRNPSRDWLRSILGLMGIKQRYSHDSTIKGIITKVKEELSDVNSVAGKTSHDTNKDDIKDWVDKSEDFHDNVETDNYIYIVKAIEDNESFLHRYACDVLRKGCEAEKKGKILKALLYNTQNTQTKKIVHARESFKEKLHYNYDLFTGSYIMEVEGVLVNVPEKDVSDLPIEIWVKDQVEGESQPFLMNLDKEVE